MSIPLAARINPGIYALIFGSGQFGATGFGAMPESNPAIAGCHSFFGWWEIEPGNWSWNPWFANANTTRFVVEGFPVPEPSAGMPGACGALLLTYRKRRGALA